MKIYYVEWLDSSMSTHGWQARSDGEEMALSPCKSVGIIIKKTKERIVIAPTWSEALTSQESAIPKSCITKMECIKEIK